MRKFNSRILLIILVLLICFLVVRTLAIPPSFGTYGWYRADSVNEIASLPEKFADTYQCFDCHPEEYTGWNVGEHKNVNCESCHGALRMHVENPEEYKGYDDYLSPRAYPSTQRFCLSCHEKSKIKPEDFPQVTMLKRDCLECHNPHNPG